MGLVPLSLHRDVADFLPEPTSLMLKNFKETYHKDIYLKLTATEIPLPHLAFSRLTG